MLVIAACFVLVATVALLFVGAAAAEPKPPAKPLKNLPTRFDGE